MVGTPRGTWISGTTYSAYIPHRQRNGYGFGTAVIAATQASATRPRPARHAANSDARIVACRRCRSEGSLPPTPTRRARDAQGRRPSRYLCGKKIDACIFHTKNLKNTATPFEEKHGRWPRESEGSDGDASTPRRPRSFRASDFSGRRGKETSLPHLYPFASRPHLRFDWSFAILPCIICPHSCLYSKPRGFLSLGSHHMCG